jgi:anti-anti-sigma factor
MKLYELTHGEFLVLHPAGRLDSTTSDAFEREITSRVQSGAHNVVLDLEDLEYISSAGLRALLLSAKLISGRGGSLTLCAMKPNVSEVFEISGFADIFSIHGSVEDAVSTERT